MILAALAVAAGSARAASCTPPPPGMVGWWPGEGNANDNVGTNNGTLAGGAVFASGKVGQGFRLDGTNGYVQIPDSIVLKPTNVTVEAWVWLDPNLSRSMEYIMFKKNSRSTLFEGYSLNTEARPNGSGTNIERFAFGVAKGGVQVIAYSTTEVQRGVWYHVAGTYDGNKLTLLVNGVAETAVIPGFQLDYGTRPVFIGTTGESFDAKLAGIVDEPSIYNRALSTNEIQAIYNAGSAGKCNSTSPTSPAVPAISSFAPATGTSGATITISGTNFSATAASNVVFFGAVRAPVLSASPTSLQMTVPTGATFAPVTVTVSGLTAYADQPFLPTFPGNGQITNSSLAARLDLAAGTGPNRVAIADLDGDGKPDLIIADAYDGKISLYRNISTNGSLTAGSFGLRVDLSVLLPSSGQNPFTIVTADLDGDGRLDLVALNADSNVVSILRNLSSPGILTTNSFAARIDLPAGTFLRGLAVQDLNGDGRPEIVTASQTSPGSISIFQNLSTVGNIAFAAKVDFAAGIGSASVAIGDLDGDGKPDLVVANYDAGTISVFRNLGTGNNLTTNSFASKVDFPAVAQCYSMAIGDLDGDGKLDLVVGGAQYSQAISVYRNLATVGSFTASSFAPRVDFAAPGWVNSLALGDLDGDGKLDIALVSQIPDVFSIFKNVSVPGSFTTASLAGRVDYSAGYNPVGISVGDLDGDGRPDIAFANFYDATISIYRNQTPIMVTPPVITPPVITGISLTIGTPGTSITISGTNFSATAASNIVYFGAVRAVVSFASPTSLLVTVPTGATFAPITVTVGGLVAYSVAPFEPTFTGNGAAIGTSTFAPGVNLNVPSPITTVIADLDGDGKPDLVAANVYANSISLYQNIGSTGVLNAASFAAPVVYAVGSGSDNPIGVTVADMDGDGKLDLLVADRNNNQIVIYRNISSGGVLTTNSFAPPVFLTVAADPRRIAVRDLDGDGRPDIVSANNSGTLSILRNIGAAGSISISSFAPRVDLALAGSAESVAVGDLDGDGKPDLAVADSTGFISLFRNHCTPGNISVGTFDARADLPAQSGSLTVVIGDLDGDGKPELIASAYLPQTMSVYRNLSTPGSLTTNSFAAPVDYALAGRGHSIALSDINGDGKPDIAEVTELADALSLFQNIGAGGFTNTSLAARVDYAAGWNAWGVAVGDLDGDGRPDAVFGNVYDNTLTLYKNIVPFGAPATCTPAPAGLVGWWKGDGSTLDSIAANNGVNQNITYSNGVVGQAFAFDPENYPYGTYTGIQMADQPAYALTNSLTIEGWIRPRGDSYMIFWRGDHRPGLDPYFISMQGSNTLFGICDADGNSVFVAAPVSYFAWTHVAAKLDGSSGTLSIYTNGVLAAQTNTTIRPFGNLLADQSPGVGIGNLNDGGNNFPFIGDIDEIGLYNRALSVGEIQAIYNAGSLGKCPVFAGPAIIMQPTNQTVLAGGTTSFNAAASGTQPLIYQWNFNGTNISGATNSTLTLASIQVSQAGNYAVLVTNLYGTATSSNASLTVVVPAVPPTILSQTPNQVVLLGNPATFSVNANGSDPLRYFWKRDGALISGATNFFYTLNNAQLSDSGSKFSCLVTNAYGFAASTNATLKVIDTIANDLCSGAIIITNAYYTNVQSTARASSFGDPVPGCVDGFGNGVWYHFTAPVGGLLLVDTFGSDFDTGLAIYTGSCDALTELACNDDTGGVTSQVTIPTTAGTTYSILVGGYSAHVGNLVFHLTYLTPPAFDVQPTNISVIVSSNGNFSTTLSGTLPMSLQWYFNNSPLADGGRISGSTNTTLNITGVLTNDAGSYQLVASNIVGVTTSSVAVLTPIILPPVFILQPANQSVLTGSNVTFTAAVDGTPPYNYQWAFNGSPLADNTRISGSATTSLSISNLVTSDAGSYTLTVTNVSGSINTTAVLIVLVPPSITLQPVGRSVPPGLPTTLNASASGIPAPAYQWQLNGTNIPGATGASYTIAAVNTNHLGFYHLVASNSVSVATSSDAQLTFGPVAAWGRNLFNESLPPPGLSDVIAIAGTSGAGFAVRTNGGIVSWGTGNVSIVPANATNVVAIASSGNGATAALRADGIVVGWNGASVPALSNIVSVSVGNLLFGMALRAEGTVAGWGAAPYSTIPAGLNHVTAVACGQSHSLALRNDGTVASWGSGAGTNVPAGLTNVTAIAAGYSHSLALKSNGTVTAWGSGKGTNLPPGLTNIAAISASSYVSGQTLCLAVRSNGVVVAWGDNSNGETNVPAALNNLVSVAVAATTFHGLSLVNDGSPVILHPPVGLTAFIGRDVTLHGDAVGAQPLNYQWLLNGTILPGATNTSLILSNLQFSNAGNYQLFVSNNVNTALSLSAPLTVLSNNTLTILSQQTASQTNYQGSKVTVPGVIVLGNGPLRYQWFFARTNNNYTAVPGATNETLVMDPALAINTGNYYVAVSNQFAGITNAPVFVRVLFAKAWGNFAADPPFNVTNAIAIAVGNIGQGSSSGHYLVLKSDGKISSWTLATSSFGETNFTALSNSIVTAIAAGYQDSLALKSDGTVYAAGYNVYGETTVPAGLSGVTAIACGDYHDLALKLDGTVAGWGQNIYSQTTNAAATTVVAIAAGGQNSMALRADGSVVTWGSFGGGQNSAPLNATNVIAIAAGGSHFLALRANGTVVGWGNNTYGQTTISTNLTNIVAIAAAANHSTLLRNDGTVVTLGNYLNGSTSNSIPGDLANVIAIAGGGDHDLALFGTRAPAFTVQPWNRTISLNATTNITLAAKCAGVQPIRYQWQLNGTNFPGATNDSMTLRNDPPFTRIQSGIYQLIVSNSYGVVASKFSKLTVLYPLGDAVDATNLNWTTTGIAQWFGETNITHDGVDAARSGAVGALQETVLQTTFGTNFSGQYTFWWKVSSELDFDFLEFRINGTVQTSISGEVDWQQVSIPVAAGTNVLQWRYSKDSSYDSGLDAAFVDQFAFVPDAPVILVQPQPAVQTVNMGASVTLSVSATGAPALRYQWQKDGTVQPSSGNLATLTLNNVGRAQSGTYCVTVTNTGGSTVSSDAVLKVLVPQVLGTPKLLPDGTFLLTSADASGGLLSPADLANFEAQASTNLMDWVTLPNALSLTNGMLQLQDSGQSNYRARYYRIVEH